VSLNVALSIVGSNNGGFLATIFFFGPVSCDDGALAMSHLAFASVVVCDLLGG